MLKNLYEFLRDNARLELFMSIVLLVAVTVISCNMDKVVEKESKSTEKAKWNGKSVVIDPGHGGKDPGKIGVNGAKEKDVNLAISKELYQVLLENQFNVVMTRTEDVVLSSGDKFSKIGDLNARCRIINDTYAKNQESVLISIHQNSFTSESVHGAQCFYYQRSEKSRQLAEIVQKHLNENINTDKPKKAKPNDSYYMLINSKCPGVIIECGFLSNSSEAAKLINDEYQKKIAEIVNKCLKEYFAVE
ncbi:MAG: N-acetylmuramoyl-L-alanine amidase family protein [Eubacterium sp.]